MNAIAPGMVVTDLVYSGRTQKQAEDFIEDAKKSAVLAGSVLHRTLLM